MKSLNVSVKWPYFMPKRFLALLCFCVIFVFINITPPLLLKTTVFAASAEITRPYKSDTEIVPGTIVSSLGNKDGYVTQANSSNSNLLLGVAVKPESSLLAVNPQDGNVQVALGGLVNTLVSTYNGDIKAGDMVAASSINGVGVKAKPGMKVIGIAQKAFTKGDTGSKTQQLKDEGGKQKDVSMGYIPVVIAIGTMLVGTNTTGTTAIERWASEIAGKSVSVLRIVICATIAVVALTSLIVMVYSSIRNSIIAVSRNPLAKPAIFEALAQVMAMVAFVSFISVTTMYVVLRI